MTVVPGYFARELPLGIQTGHVLDALRAGADILAPHNLTMVLEPLSDNPDLFLRTSDQGYAACRAVNSPACKILFDMYHMQKNEGHMILTSTTWSKSGTSRLVTIRDARSPAPAGQLPQHLQHTPRRCRPRVARLRSAWNTATQFPQGRRAEGIDAYVGRHVLT
jgi:hypothetical protein